jgi:hypothetical protein
MAKTFKSAFYLFLIFYAVKLSAQKEIKILTVPGKDAFTHIDKNGTTVLPSGRYATPAGQTIQITHDPFGMAVSPMEQKQQLFITEFLRLLIMQPCLIQGCPAMITVYHHPYQKVLF